VVFYDNFNYNCLHSIELDWTGLDWTGLDWTGLDWTGLDWTGLDWTGRSKKKVKTAVLGRCPPPLAYCFFCFFALLQLLSIDFSGGNMKHQYGALLCNILFVRYKQ
jgi:hypothetical protein